LETAHQGLVHRHHASGIVEFAAVIGSGEKRDELSLGEEFVSILYDLMRSGDEVHVVSVEEFCDDVGAESKRDASVVFAPTLDVFVGIGPKQVAQESGVRNVGRTHDTTDLLHGLQIR